MVPIVECLHWGKYILRQKSNSECSHKSYVNTHLMKLDQRFERSSSASSFVEARFRRWSFKFKVYLQRPPPFLSSYD